MFGNRWNIFVLASFVIFSLSTLSAATDSGTTGRLKIHASPKEAYVFVDGSAIRDGINHGTPRPLRQLRQ
jgi:hypothetical protein